MAFSLFHLYAAAAAPFDPRTQRGVHLAGVLFLIFLCRPVFRGRARFMNTVCALLGAALSLYIVFDQTRVADQAAIPEFWETPFGWVDFQTPMGIGLTVLLLVATTRTLGPALPGLAVLSFLYAYYGNLISGEWGHAGFNVDFIVGNTYLSLDAVFGLPVQVSSTILAMFVIFGSFLLRAGQSEFFTEFSLRLAGKTRGGPAQVATISSALVGTISGSAVGNVACTGSFSIPLMKSRGYAPAFAGAVEAAASTGGQILPPVMGAGAFVMAETLGIPYTHIAVAAAVPANLYFLNILISIHFEATRLGLKGIDPSDMPPWPEVLRKFYLLVPLFVLVYFLNEGFSPMRSAIWALWTLIAITNVEAVLAAVLRPAEGDAGLRRRGLVALAVIVALFVALPPLGPLAAFNFGAAVIASTIVLQVLKVPTRLDFVRLVECLREGGIAIIEVAAACATAGVVIGVINLTGVGIKLTTLIISSSQGYLFIALLLSALSSIILGMGLPTTVAYIIAGAVAAPALMDFGVDPLTGHLFVFYYAIVSVITPPVCMAAYVASGLANSHWFTTARIAVKLALPSFIVPFLFVYEPAFLLEADWVAVLWSTLTAFCGIILLSGAIIGHAASAFPGWLRPVYLAAALMLLEGSLWTDFAGAVLAILLVLDQVWRLKRAVPGELDSPT